MRQSPSPWWTVFAALALIVLLANGCTPRLHRFPLAEPLTVDADQLHVAQKPELYYSGMFTDAVDQTSWQPTRKALSVDVPGPAVNVNSLDEVPDSSWFTNRIGSRPLTPEEAARGSCPDVMLDPAGPWTVKAAKPDGVNPGFMIEGDDGRYYMLKFDGHSQPERASTADVFGSRVYHAAGYNAPCNSVVYFDPAILEIDPEAATENSVGRKRPMTTEDLDQVLAAGIAMPDGTLRGLASQFVTGKPIGPWRYQGTRKDDPNDVVRHEDRRDIRGARLVAAWLNHFDAREQNTLDTWVTVEGRSFVRHHYIDFGDSLGWDFMSEEFARRHGLAYYLDIGLLMADSLTFGGIKRPYEDVELSELMPSFGYFDVDHFDPQRWKTGFPNVAFTRMLPEDGAWMARILARFTDEHVRVMLDEARLSDAVQDAELYRILLGRRDRLLQVYLTQRSPLTGFTTRVDDGMPHVCFEDLAITAGVTDPRTVRYESLAYFGRFDEPRWSRHEFTDQPPPTGGACVDLVHDDLRPARDYPTDGSNSAHRYVILDLLVHTEPGGDPLPPARLHFYDLGAQGFALVGIERPGLGIGPLDGTSR